MPIGQTVVDIWQIFKFFKTVAVRHLGLVLYVFGPPTKGGIWWPCDCAKFDSNQRSNFNSVQGLIFCTLSSKRPIHAPKIEFFGI